MKNVKMFKAVLPLLLVILLCLSASINAFAVTDDNTVDSETALAENSRKRVDDDDEEYEITLDDILAK